MLEHLFGHNNAEFMDHPGRNCAIPDEFNGQEIGSIADQWFPSELGEIRYAKRLCLNCPVARQCFMYAFDHPELEGIWGGTSTGQRAALRNRKRKAA